MKKRVLIGVSTCQYTSIMISILCWLLYAGLYFLSVFPHTIYWLKQMFALAYIITGENIEWIP